MASLPASRMKAGRDYRAPLSKKAQAIIEGRPRFDKCAFVFTTNGKVAINGWGKAKQTLDQYISEELGEPVADWRLHDLRRTCASGLAKLGVRACTEFCVNGLKAGDCHLVRRHNEHEEARRT